MGINFYKHFIVMTLLLSSAFFLSEQKLSSKADVVHSQKILKFAPPLSNNTDNIYFKDNLEQRQEYALRNLKNRHHLTPSAALESYETIETHPLILEAVDILTKSLRNYARGVYITSMNRTWDDQYRLSHHRRSRRWTTSRSKHLIGMAADIGFVGRKRNMWKIHAAAEKILKRNLGISKSKMIRVVRERHCIHVEIDTRVGRELIEKRSHILENIGIISESKHRKWNPVPEMSEYLPLQTWNKKEATIQSLAF